MPAMGSGLGKKGGSGSPARAAALLCLLSVVLFTLSCREAGTGPISTVKGAFTVVTTPVRYVGAAISTPFSSIANIVGNVTADEATLSELKAENESLTKRNAELEEAEQTATRLQGLLDLQNTYSLKSTAAYVISRSSDTWTSTVTIDKGTASGLSVGMPVTDSAGVIGQISACGVSSSTVRLITDENSSVSAMVQSSRAQGMLTGSADGTLRLTLVRTDQTVKVGDLVVTSGLGGIYPKGLPLGKVSSIEQSSGSMYYTIVVKPLTSTSSLEEVLVITSLSDDQKATSNDAKAANEQDVSAATTAVTTDSSTDSGTDQPSDSSDDSE